MSTSNDQTPPWEDESDLPLFDAPSEGPPEPTLEDLMAMTPDGPPATRAPETPPDLPPIEIPEPESLLPAEPTDPVPPTPPAAKTPRPPRTTSTPAEAPTSDAAHVLAEMRAQTQAFMTAMSAHTSQLVTSLSNAETLIRDRTTTVTTNLSEQGERLQESYQNTDQALSMAVAEVKDVMLTEVKPRVEQLATDLQAVQVQTLAELERTYDQGRKAVLEANHSASAITTQLQAEVRKLRWKNLLGTGVATGIVVITAIALLTWLRPAWTLSQEQQEELQLGHSVIQDYRASSTERRAEMRKIMNWKEPDDRLRQPQSKRSAPDPTPTPAQNSQQ